MARYVDWCNRRAKGIRLWQIIGLFALCFVAMLLAFGFGGELIGYLFSAFVLLPVLHFLQIAGKVWMKETTIRQDQYEQLQKTRKLLKGFRK
ncbi:hypothetical protein [Ruegeria sp. HKCCD7255]|uniref:hypothetical protein n=1 Tax=Ruegeria sp. HKCCD7255 TaxID=2683004 RepID=UPI001489C2A4|nr:hypothetical protein [Ruegeria sp. HKCCD7255]